MFKDIVKLVQCYKGYSSKPCMGYFQAFFDTPEDAIHCAQELYIRGVNHTQFGVQITIVVV